MNNIIENSTVHVHVTSGELNDCFVDFEHRTLGECFLKDVNVAPKNCLVADGAVIQNADTKYPDLWAYLQSEKGVWRVVTEDEWQAMIHEDGMGGAPKFVLDTNAKTLRLPDIRGDYMAGSGWNGKKVGNSDGDAIRNIKGKFQPGGGQFAIAWAGSELGEYPDIFEGVLTSEMEGFRSSADTRSQGSSASSLSIDASNVVPTDIRNHPATAYMLPCVYVGKSVSQDQITQSV